MIQDPSDAFPFFAAFEMQHSGCEKNLIRFANISARLCATLMRFMRPKIATTPPSMNSYMGISIDGKTVSLANLAVEKLEHNLFIAMM